MDELEQLRVLLSGLAQRMTNVNPVLDELGEISVSSIQRNFQEGGRFGSGPFGGGTSKWAPSKRSVRDTDTARSRTGKTLIDTGRLAASVTFSRADNTLLIGTNVVYAVVHQFGAAIAHPGGSKYIVLGPGVVRFVSKGAKRFTGFTAAHIINIPARPFLVLQDEDITEMFRVILRYYSTILAV